MNKKKLWIIIGIIAVVCLLVSAGLVWATMFAGGGSAEEEVPTETQVQHDHAFTLTEEGKASCDQDGITVHKCECGAERIELVQATGHTYGDWTVTREPTCVKEGLEESACSVCGNKETRTVACSKHSYELVVNDEGQSYECSNCDDMFAVEMGEKEEVDFLTSRYVPDCDTDYSFRIYCPEDEDYIRDHLEIVDAYFRNTAYEVPIEYTISGGYNSYWTIKPTKLYTPGNTYVASRTGNVLFEGMIAQDWTFHIERQESKNMALSEDVIFLQALENKQSGYYPYHLTYSEASDSYWVSLGKTDGLKVGDLICVGTAVSLDDVMVAQAGDNVFGKIKQICTDDVGSCFLELQAPELTELFSVLDIYSSDILSSQDVVFLDHEAMAQQATQLLYQSDDFAKFICAAQTTSVTYLASRGYTTPTSTLMDFIKSIHIDTDKSQWPSIQDNVIKGNIVLEGSLSIPVELTDVADYGQLGEIKLTFTAEISLDSMEVVLQLEEQTVEINGGQQVVKAQIGSKQQITTTFTVGADLDLEWSMAAKPYVLNTKTNKFHYESCKHVQAVKDTSNLTKMTSQQLFQKIADESISVENECKTCLPISSLLSDSFVINENTGKVHLPSCGHVKGANASSVRVSELPLGNLLLSYEECKDCEPTKRSSNSFSEQVLNTMKTKDLGSSMEEFKALAKEIGDGDDAGEIQLIKFPFTITGWDSIDLSLGVYFDFTLDANLEYVYQQQIDSWFGIYLKEDGFEPYADSNREAKKNNLTLTGEARVDVGLSAAINIYLKGVEKYCYAKLTAQVGVYAELHGALQHDFMNSKNNYAAAYFEAGVHCNLYGSARLAFIEKKNQTFIPEKYQDIPFMKYGYEKVYYNYDGMPEEVVVDSIYYDLEDAGLLNAKYFNMVDMTSGTETLQIMGMKDKYTVDFALKNGTNCTVNSGYLLVNTPYESFTDELTITVKGYDQWSKFRRGNAKYTLGSYTVQIRYDAAAVDTTKNPVPEGGIEYNGHYYKLYNKTCTSWEEAKRYCEMKGGYLAVITSQAENDAVFAYLKECGAETAYIGLTDSAQEGTWEWVNGEKFEYSNWASGEPNNEGGSENYAEYYYLYPNGEWNDGNYGRGTANDIMSFICEWETYEFIPERDPQQTMESQMNAILGYYEGWYTATQGITGGALGIHRTNALLADEAALQMYADRATECAKDRQGNATKTYTVEEIRKIVEEHEGEYIVIYMFGPLRENPDVEDGLYTMSVEYNAEADELNFKGSQWIQRDTYVFANMHDVVGLSGMLTANICAEGGSKLGTLLMNRYTPSFEEMTE